MRNIKLLIEYDGANYHGWQRQLNAHSIQEEIENAIFKLTKEKVNLVASGRTDVGVHALGQVANFCSCSTIPAERISYALNSILPDDVVIISAVDVSQDFHARYSAEGKKYKYLIYNRIQPSVFMRSRAYHIKGNLDIDLMKNASKLMLGYHNFRAFCASGSGAKSFEREIFDILISKDKNDDIITIEVIGNGFLYNMVRIISGTLVEIGLGKRKQSDVLEAIETGERSKAGKTAPAHGLYLVEVLYKQD